MAKKIELKIVNSGGQICIGKNWAGQQIQIEKKNDNTLIITRGRFIPEGERWLYRDSNLKKLMKAVEWSENNPRRDNFKEIEQRILSDD